MGSHYANYCPRLASPPFQVFEFKPSLPPLDEDKNYGLPGSNTREAKDAQFSTNKELIDYINTKNDALRAQIFSEHSNNGSSSVEFSGRLLFDPCTTARHDGQKQFHNNISSHQVNDVVKPKSVGFGDRQRVIKEKNRGKLQDSLASYLRRKL